LNRLTVLPSLFGKRQQLSFPASEPEEADVTDVGSATPQQLQLAWWAWAKRAGSRAGVAKIVREDELRRN